MAVVVGAPAVDTFVAAEIAQGQRRMTLDSLTHRVVTKESEEEEWKTFEVLSHAADAGLHIRRG